MYFKSPRLVLPAQAGAIYLISNTGELFIDAAIRRALGAASKPNLRLRYNCQI